MNKYTLCLSVCTLVCIHTDNLCKFTIVNDALQVLPVICPRTSEVQTCITHNALKTLIWAFVLSCTDYYNSLLAGFPKTCRLQICAACLVCCSPRFDHIHVCNPSFFPAGSRVQYKIVLICKSLSNLDFLQLHVLPHQLCLSANTQLLHFSIWLPQMFR